MSTLGRNNSIHHKVLARIKEGLHKALVRFMLSLSQHLLPSHCQSRGGTILH